MSYDHVLIGGLSSGYDKDRGGLRRFLRRQARHMPGPRKMHMPSKPEPDVEALREGAMLMARSAR